MDIWVTKYALSGGIKKIRAEHESNFPGMVRDLDQMHAYYHGEGKDWHRTEAGALARAEQMRTDKIASLRKQIAKLEKLNFGGSDAPR